MKTEAFECEICKRLYRVEEEAIKCQKQCLSWDEEKKLISRRVEHFKLILSELDFKINDEAKIFVLTNVAEKPIPLGVGSSPAEHRKYLLEFQFNSIILLDFSNDNFEEFTIRLNKLYQLLISKGFEVHILNLYHAHIYKNKDKFDAEMNNSGFS
ncbi:MAG: hypothetical protein ACTSQY_00820 [Candidatus Odinarchaeia archaeon]